MIEENEDFEKRIDSEDDNGAISSSVITETNDDHSLIDVESDNDYSSGKTVEEIAPPNEEKQTEFLKTLMCWSLIGATQADISIHQNQTTTDFTQNQNEGGVHQNALLGAERQIDLLQHMVLQQSSLLPQMIEFSGGTLSQPLALLRTSSKDRPFVCEYCSHTFRRLIDLEHHMSAHRKKPYCCPICKKCFATEQRIESHNFWHKNRRHAAPDENYFACEKCGKEYKTKWNLRRHMKDSCGAFPSDFFDFMGDLNSPQTSDSPSTSIMCATTGPESRPLSPVSTQHGSTDICQKDTEQL